MLLYHFCNSFNCAKASALYSIVSPVGVLISFCNFVELQSRTFSKEACRSMVAMLDTDRSGKLGFEEFKVLWTDIRDWKVNFYNYNCTSSLILMFYFVSGVTLSLVFFKRSSPNCA